MTRALALFLFLSPLLTWGAFTLPPPPQQRVNDYAESLKPQHRSYLESKFEAFERKTGHQSVVAIFPTLEGESIDDVANRLFQKWGVGEKKANDGILLVLALQDRAFRIETGYGVESVLTDAVSSRILRRDLAPHLREGRLDGALLSYINALDLVFEDAKNPGKAVKRPVRVFNVMFWVLIIFGVPLMIFPSAIFRRGRRSRSFSSRGVHSTFGGWGGGWGGGGFGGGGGGGSSWGGGGGLSGGGGASGRW